MYEELKAIQESVQQMGEHGQIPPEVMIHLQLQIMHIGVLIAEVEELRKIALYASLLLDATAILAGRKDTHQVKPNSPAGEKSPGTPQNQPAKKI